MYMILHLGAEHRHTIIPITSHILTQTYIIRRDIERYYSLLSGGDEALRATCRGARGFPRQGSLQGFLLQAYVCSKFSCLSIGYANLRYSVYLNVTILVTHATNKLCSTTQVSVSNLHNIS
jgi:hypothetical protein